VITQVTLNVPPGIAALPAAVAAVLPELAKALENDIAALAQRELKTSLIEYQQGLKLSNFPVKATALKSSTVKFATISLAGWLANAVETGWGGGNMVPSFVKGRGLSPPGGKRGTYATIRFRHQKGKTAGVAGMPMGSLESKRGMNKQQAALVGRKIGRAAKNDLTNNASAPAPGSGKSARLSSSAASGMGAMTMKGSAPGAKQHSGSIYGGMSKRVDSAGTSYETYRRASIHVAGKWIHPGIDGHHFFDRALKRFPGHARLLIKTAVDNLKV
jgi:hypothetical protein